MGSQGECPRLCVYRGSLASWLERKEVPCLDVSKLKASSQRAEWKSVVKGQGWMGVEKEWLGRVQRPRGPRCCGDFWNSSSQPKDCDPFGGELKT